MARPRNPNHPLVRPELREAARALKEGRESFGISQKELATRLGVSSAAIARYELGLRAIPRAVAIKAAGALGYPALYRFVRPRGTPKGAPQATPAISTVRLGRFLQSDAFMIWWGARTIELAEQFALGRSDIDDALEMFIDGANRGALYTQPFEHYETDADLLQLCDKVFGHLCQLNESRRRKVAAVA